MIKLDIDSGNPLPIMTMIQRAARAGFVLRALCQWRSPSGRGWHLLIEVEPEPMTAMETVALQLLLGSDPNREAYNVNRARQVDAGDVDPYWAERWNVLYG